MYGTIMKSGLVDYSLFKSIVFHWNQVGFEFEVNSMLAVYIPLGTERVRDLWIIDHPSSRIRMFRLCPEQFQTAKQFPRLPCLLNENIQHIYIKRLLDTQFPSHLLFIFFILFFCSLIVTTCFIISTIYHWHKQAMNDTQITVTLTHNIIFILCYFFFANQYIRQFTKWMN